MTNVPAMTVDEIDTVLRKLRTDVDNTTTNLLALSNDTTYMLLTENGRAKLSITGDSVAKVVQPINAFAELFKQRTKLDEVLKKAEQLRANLPMIGKGAVLQEIANLLRGESIQFDPVEVPLAKRNMTQDSTQVVTTSVQSLLDQMIAAYGPARDAVFEVKDIWRKCQASCDGAAAESARVEKLALQLGEELPDGLKLSKQALEEYRLLFMNDPHGIHNSPSQNVMVQLKQVSEELARLKLEHDKLPQLLSTAAHDFEGLEKLRRKSAEVFDEFKAKIFAPAAKPLADAAKVEALRKRLAILNTKFAEKQWRSVNTALRRFKVDLAALSAEEQETFAYNSDLVQQRKTLQGRLQASEARAINHELVEEEALQKIYDEVEPLLYSRGRADYKGCDLSVVERLVNAYENLVRELVTRRKAKAGDGTA